MMEQFDSCFCAVGLCFSGRGTDALYGREFPAGRKWKKGPRFARSTTARGSRGVFSR